MGDDQREWVSPEDNPPSGSGPVTELPLFPLDMVLFPHMPQNLHIFEERYKEMINRCVHESLPFGIVLATGVEDSAGRTETFPIGCTARISRVERLPDGKMNIEVVGEDRFRILDTHEQFSYRMGLTEPIEDEPADAEEVIPLADEVQKLLRDYLTRTLALHGQSTGDFELPDEPEQLSFTAAWVLPLDNPEKQDLLAGTDTGKRLTVAREVLLKEVTRLRRAAESTTQVVFQPINVERLAIYRCPN
jgi:Lon protease-like protein